MSRVLLVIPPCPAHNDSCVNGVAAAPRPACHLPQCKESPHEDAPSHDPFTPTHARKGSGQFDVHVELGISMIMPSRGSCREKSADPDTARGLRLDPRHDMSKA